MQGYWAGWNAWGHHHLLAALEEAQRVEAAVQQGAQAALAPVAVRVRQMDSR